MMFEGRLIKDNGCKLHQNCLTCPKEKCIYDIPEKLNADAEILAKRAKWNARYHKNKEKLRLRRLQKKEEAKKNAERLEHDSERVFAASKIS